jgi:hypothetical protein
MRVYVAGKFEERSSIRTLMDALKEQGCSITVDWTVHEYTDIEYPVEYAIEDVNGVAKCDTYIGLFLNENSYKGALVELGVALGLKKRIMIIGHAIDSCIFANHPRVEHYDSVSECLGSL